MSEQAANEHTEFCALLRTRAEQRLTQRRGNVMRNAANRIEKLVAERDESRACIAALEAKLDQGKGEGL